MIEAINCRPGLNRPRRLAGRNGFGTSRLWGRGLGVEGWRELLVERTVTMGRKGCSCSVAECMKQFPISKSRSRNTNATIRSIQWLWTNNVAHNPKHSQHPHRVHLTHVKQARLKSPCTHRAVAGEGARLVGTVVVADAAAISSRGYTAGVLLQPLNANGIAELRHMTGVVSHDHCRPSLPSTVGAAGAVDSLRWSCCRRRRRTRSTIDDPRRRRCRRCPPPSSGGDIPQVSPEIRPRPLAGAGARTESRCRSL